MIWGVTVQLNLLQVAGVKVNLFSHDISHGTPDAVFPNNWFSTHAAFETNTHKSTLVIYPMKAPNRSACSSNQFEHACYCTSVHSKHTCILNPQVSQPVWVGARCR